MTSQRNEQENLRTSIFSIELSKGPRSPPMRKGTAFTVKLDGSFSTYLMTSCSVVERSGATSSSRLTCKRFGQSLPEEKHPINPDSAESINMEEFCIRNRREIQAMRIDVRRLVAFGTLNRFLNR